MKMQSTASAIALIAALGFSGQALAADPLAPSPAPTTGSSALPDRTTAAINAIGKDVKNQVGQDIGEVHDIVAEKTTNEVYAVISVGGFLGIGEKDIVVSLSSLNVGSENVILMTQSTADSLKASSPYEPSRYRSLAMNGPRSAPNPALPDRSSDDNGGTSSNGVNAPGGTPSATGGAAEAAGGMGTGGAGTGGSAGAGTGGGTSP